MKVSAYAPPLYYTYTITATQPPKKVVIELDEAEAKQLKEFLQHDTRFDRAYHPLTQALHGQLYAAGV